MKAINKAFEYFLAQDIEVKKGRPKITYREKLIFLFKILIESGWRNEEGVLIVPFEKIIVEPYFYYDASISPYEELPFLFKAVQTDKDFYRKHNMLNYEPTFTFNTNHEYSSVGEDLVFKDYTDDFLKEYLKDRLEVKSNNKNNDKSIKKIEILKDESEKGRIKVYINGKDENEPLDFARKGNWELLYKIANKEYISSDNKKNQNFCTYFNSRKENPLYATYGFKPTKILKIVESEILPNIEIKLIGKNTRKITA